MILGHSRRARLKLFDSQAPWARSIARAVAKRIPPCFPVEDLEQVAGAELWKQTRLYDPSRGVPFEGFALTAIRGACYMSVRRREYTDTVHSSLETGGVGPPEEWYGNEARQFRQELTDPGPGPERQAELVQFRERINAVLLDLPQLQRKVLEYHYLDGVPLTECARRMGRPVAELYNLKAEALQEAQRRLNDCHS